MGIYLKIGINRQDKRFISFWVKRVYLGCICCLCFLLLVSCNLSSDSRKTPTIPLQETATPPTPFVITATHIILPSSLVLATDNPTQTSIPSSTMSAPPPSSTSTAIPTQRPGPMAVVIQLWNTIDGGSAEVLDDNFNLIYSLPTRYVWLSSFSPDGCRLRGINYADGDFTIRELDLRGIELTKITALSKEKEDKAKIYQFILSPSGRWLAYKIVDDIKMSVQGAGIQDVRLLRVDEQKPQEVLRLTKRGGARPAGIAWSPDSRYLAYTDSDEAGIMQIFIYNPEEKKEYQITQFTQEMRDHEIEDLKWSPDSKMITFLIVGIRETAPRVEVTDNGARGIISLPDFSLKWLNMKGYENYKLRGKSWGVYNNWSWWSKNSQTLLIPLQLETGKSRMEYVGWYDLGLDEIVHLLPASDFTDQSDFSFFFPLDDLDKIGIWGAEAAVYIYNRNTQDTVKLKNPYFLLDNSVFLVAPNGPIDLNQCLQ